MGIDSRQIQRLIDAQVAGGPATIADGANVVEGALADAVVAAGAAGSLSAKLRRLTTDLSALLALLPAAAAPAAATPYGSLTKLMALPMLDNGASLDPAHGAKELTLLASAARTAQVSGADQVNVSARGVKVYLNVTVASGTGGLSVLIQGKDPVSGVYQQLNAAPTAVTATGLKVYMIYPAVIGSGFTQTTNQVLERTWRVTVAVGDASSYTYSVGASYLN